MTRTFHYPVNPHQGVVSSNADNYFLLRMDAAAGADEPDADTGYDFTQNNSPGAAAGLFGSGVSTGARTFNGTNQYFTRTTDNSETLLQTLKWGIAFWVNADALAGNMCVIEYGEYSSPETSATNVQVEVEIRTDGTIRIWWENGTGLNVFSDSPAGVIVAGETAHIGLSCEPSPNYFDKALLRFYKNGECVGIVDNIAPMDGGADSSWIIGASRSAGSAVGTPANFFDGTLDDLVVTQWSPGPQWFRGVYARGIKDWDAQGITNYDAVSQFVRVLVNVGEDNFACLNRVDLEWVDLTDVLGIDFLDKVTWSDSVEDFTPKASVDLVPRFLCMNMSPFVQADQASNVDNPLYDEAADEHVIKPMRRIRIETATVPCGMEKDQASPYFELAFDGFIRTFNVSDDGVELGLADLGIAMLDVFVEPKYGDSDINGGTDVQPLESGSDRIDNICEDWIIKCDPRRYYAWVDNSGAGSALEITLFDETMENGFGKPHIFQAGDQIKLAAYSGATDFDGTFTVDSVTDNVVTTVETVGGVLPLSSTYYAYAVPRFSYKCGIPELYIPTVCDWFVYPWNEPPSKSVLQAMDDWVAQIGWRVRFRWHDVRQEFRLTLFDPAADFGISSLSPRMSVDRMSTKVDDMRNVDIVEYGNRADRDSVNEPKPFVAASIDKASVRDVGRMMARIALGKDTLITDEVEAQLMADGMLNDLGSTTAEVSAQTLLDLRQEIQNTIGFVAEDDTSGQIPVIYSDACIGACTSYEHTYGADKHRTTIGMRNVARAASLALSVSRVDRHHEVIASRGSTPGRGLSPPVALSAPTVRYFGLLNSNRQGMVIFDIPAANLNLGWDEVECHISSSGSTFTPSSSTLMSVGRTSFCYFDSLSSGTTYYVRTVVRDRMGNRSDPSTAASFST